jgi:hypothetical protein
LLPTYAAVASVSPMVGLATLHHYLTSLAEMFFTTATIGMAVLVPTRTAIITTNVSFC